MKIQSMFQKDINRDINGVVKVAQDDEKSLHQELSEYIITKELRRHFRTFFDNYTKAIDQPTDKMGVWISGFFGSGKSHFLKMLSYLLSNKEVQGVPAIDYFKDKFDDPMMYAQAVKCVSIPTESILFNIDIEGPINKDKTAVLRTFAKMFYNHCGFYGDDLKIAKLERFIDRQGKTEEFRQKFEEVNGGPWVETRDSFAFFEDDVVEVLQSVLGMSEQAARNWFNGEETNELSIAQLVSDIKEYVDSKGDKFRLLFMVDEVGQYIGDDGDLMINLQSLVEELGAKCLGKVWVMVTSQEAIDSVVKIAGDDFSKIQGRFNTRLSLSSSSVDEVIKKRVLAKTEEADQLLHMVYDKEQAVLKNLFVFNDSVLDIKGFADGREFAATFPFVPYQFIIIQKVLAEIRKHGNSGKHLSGGERSMLSGFQEAAQKVQDKDENALLPFYLFYDTVHTFLESAIRRVIDRCQNAADNHDGIEPQDVAVLKLLYLVRYIDDIKANIDNIATLMVDDIRTDKIALRASVTASLERLQSQNYVSRNGDTYAFLTDEEQDVAVDIKNTVVDSNQITQSIAQTVFGEIYPAKKFKHGRYDFSYDQYIDETINGSASGGIRLRVITVASDHYKDSDQQLIMESQVNNEAIVVLSGDTPYYDELEQAMKIRKYVKQKNVSQLPETIQDIIRKRQQQARHLEDRAKGYLEKAIVDAKVVVHGEVMAIKAGSAKDKLDAALSGLVESVYSKLNMVNHFVESDADILAILNGSADADLSLVGSGANNEDALNEISQWLELKSVGPTISMGDVQRRYQAIPYGWKEIDIAALIARLIAQQKISIKYGGAVVAKDDRRLVDYLRKKSEVDKAVVARRIAPSEDLMRKSISFLRDYLGAMDIPGDEDGLVRFVLNTFEAKLAHYQDLLDQYAQNRYPEKEQVTTARDLAQDILSQRKDNVALLNRMVQKQDDLLDSSEDMEGVELFFKSQRTVFDEAVKQMNRVSRERDYFATDPDTQEVFRTISGILAMPKPYNRIGELPELIGKVKAAYQALLELKKEEVAETIRQCMQDVHQLAGEARDAGALLKQADDYFAGKREAAKEALSLTELDAMITQLLNHKDTVCKRMEVMAAPAPEPQAKESGEAKQAAPAPKKIATVRRYDLCSVKRLQSRDDIDAYVEGIRQKLYQTLESCDGVQVN
ncbi:MAG: BREX system P-loop protein BrxC [Flintibacter sp.]|uniref:BREX system P-loop protein BrxC n=1 Tax=Flintibacter sp. TaxID=1918624 RepID=UPI002673EAFC|nr:BREX system P-loop protein BrxC [Flintibacter sp.]MCI6150868.1 BREX system P-loop protein BrxC [Flintibacter sp.]MDY5038236.1 BREX system P-loop protein BrxC [Lawsonibacter sp.]